MPTYEYRCRSCGEQLEVVQAFTDDALTTHEACGGELRKVFGSVGISFKGSGFYKNDSRSKTSSTTSAGESGSTSGATEGSSTSDKNGSGSSDKSASSDTSSSSSTTDKAKSASGSTSSGSGTSSA